jgi:hypothetical protein
MDTNSEIRELKADELDAVSGSGGFQVQGALRAFPSPSPTSTPTPPSSGYGDGTSLNGGGGQPIQFTGDPYDIHHLN